MLLDNVIPFEHELAIVLGLDSLGITIVSDFG